MKYYGELLWTGIKGVSLLVEEKKQIQKHHISGIILFKRNIESLSQLFELCREIHSLNPKPLLMIDREGGRVDRLNHLPDFRDWPTPYWQANTCTLKEVEQTYFNIAQEIKALGISVNFAPLADLYLAKSDVLKNRTYGSDPKLVCLNVLAVLKGFKKAGLIGCVKHFPGHGGVAEDSHHQLPVDNRDFKTLQTKDLLPFIAGIKQGVELVMTSHVLFPKIDPLWPATLSPFFLKKVLRKQLKFLGLIVSDDMDMKALSTLNSLPQNLAQFLKAGGDIVLKCEPCNLEHLSELMKQALMNKALSEEEFLAKIKRIQNLKQKCAPIKPLPSLKELKQFLRRTAAGEG